MLSRILLTLRKSSPLLSNRSHSLGSYTAMSTRFLSTAKPNAELELSSAETLIKECIQFKKWLYAEQLFKQDERPGWGYYLRSTFGSVNPSESQLKEVVVNELQNAFDAGQYADFVEITRNWHKNPDYLAYCEKQKSDTDPKSDYIEQSSATETHQRYLDEFCQRTGTSKKDFMHHAESLPAKCILLRLLGVPIEVVDQKLIDHTLKSIGFKVRQAIFLDIVELHLTYGGQMLTKSFGEADFFCFMSDKIRIAKNPVELNATYTILKNSSFGSRLCFTARPILDFIISGQIGTNTYWHLSEKCTHSFSFASPKSHYHQSNTQEFSTLKPIIENLACVLLKDRFDPIYEDLLHSVQSAKNEVELVQALYNPQLRSKFELKAWDEVRWKMLLKTPLFSDSNRYIEQLYVILTNAAQAGYVFELDESLIKEHIIFEKWFITDMLSDDERGTGTRYVTDKFGTASPTDSQIRKELVKELLDALHKGTYQELAQEMRSHHECSSCLTERAKHLGPLGPSCMELYRLSQAELNMDEANKDACKISALSIQHSKPKELTLIPNKTFYEKYKGLFKTHNGKLNAEETVSNSAELEREIRLFILEQIPTITDPKEAEMVKMILEGILNQLIALDATTLGRDLQHLIDSFTWCANKAPLTSEVVSFANKAEKILAVRDLECELNLFP